MVGRRLFSNLEPYIKTDKHWADWQQAWTRSICFRNGGELRGTEVRRSMKFFLSMERPATLFNTLKKNVISLAQCDTQTLSSSWEFISVKVKDCHWPNASDGVFTYEPDILYRETWYTSRGDKLLYSSWHSTGTLLFAQPITNLSNCS